MDYLNFSEVIILALTLLTTVFFFYRSVRIQQKILTIKSAEEFSESINKKRRELEAVLKTSIKDGARLDPELLLSVEKDPKQRLVLVNFLNTYESMARGINLGAYDEKIFKVARQVITKNTYFAFEDFITLYRSHYDRPHAWIEFEKLVFRWKKISTG